MEANTKEKTVMEKAAEEIQKSNETLGEKLENVKEDAKLAGDKSEANVVGDLLDNTVEPEPTLIHKVMDPIVETCGKAKDFIKDKLSREPKPG